MEVEEGNQFERSESSDSVFEDDFQQTIALLDMDQVEEVQFEVTLTWRSK